MREHEIVGSDWTAPFAGEGRLYAVIDGASMAGLAQRLAAARQPAICLYEGEDATTLAGSAPWLVELDGANDAVNSFLRAALGRNCSITLRSRLPAQRLRTHLRRLLWVRHCDDPAPVYFRFYDPRVLRTFLATSNMRQLRAVFGEAAIEAFYAEDARASALLEFARKSPSLLALAAGSPAVEMRIWPIAETA